MKDARALALEYFKSGLKPPPDLYIDEWADQYRRLPSMGSAEPGKWDTNKTPYARQPMRDLSPQSRYQRVVLMWAVQSAKTETGNNTIGFYMHHAPQPMMMVQPTQPDATKVSRQRIAPMINSTPVLRELVGTPRARSSGNTLLVKEFPGGILVITGATSDKGLRGTPAGLLFCDEIDTYPYDVAGQGDPVMLAIKRTATFQSRKILLTSTPGIAGLSRIDREFKKSTRSYYHVPCPYCDAMQRLLWGQEHLHWDRADDGAHLPETAMYICQMCGKLIDEELHKVDMLERGEWIAENPEARVAGYHLNGLYSPWVRWTELAEEWVDAQQDTALLKTFVNTVLAEPWEDDVERVSDDELIARREDYGVPLPAGVLLLTAGVDVQGDRIEVEVVGWGVGQESWSIEWRQFHGNPAMAELWTTLDDYLRTRFLHESGARLPISCACIDTGHHTTAVYRYCRGKSKRRIFPVKGSSTPGSPLTRQPKRSRKGKVSHIKVVMVGTDTAKDAIYARLTIATVGPGYCHFPLTHGPEYFKQLTAEHVEKKRRAGQTYRLYVRPSGQAAEVLDCRVYSFAAYDLLQPNMARIAGRIRAIAKGRATADPGDDQPVATTPVRPAVKKKPLRSRRPRRRKRTGFVRDI